MRAIERVLCNIGLNMNESKTKYMAKNMEPGYKVSLENTLESWELQIFWIKDKNY